MITVSTGNDADWAFTRLRLDVFGPAAGTTRIVATGDIDMVSAPRLGAVLTDLLRHERLDAIELDLAQVPFMDSAGINTLTRCLLDAQDRQRELRVVDPQPSVRRVLDITGLLALLGVPTA